MDRSLWNLVRADVEASALRAGLTIDVERHARGRVRRAAGRRGEGDVVVVRRRIGEARRALEAADRRRADEQRIGRRAGAADLRRGVGVVVAEDEVD